MDILLGLLYHFQKGESGTHALNFQKAGIFGALWESSEIPWWDQDKLWKPICPGRLWGVFSSLETHPSPGRTLYLQHFVACVTADEHLVFEGIRGLQGFDFPMDRRLQLGALIPWWGAMKGVGEKTKERGVMRSLSLEFKA